jgi:hypothetical protein
MKISQGYLNRLRYSKSEEEWNFICDEMKKEYGGYPEDWYQKVIRSGLIIETQMFWNKP